MRKLEFYVLNYDFNKKELYNMNIFNNCKFIEGIKEAVNKYTSLSAYNYNSFKEDIQKELQYAFWCKREYELFIGDAFETNLDNYEKVDVYSQVLPNLDLLCNYILDNMKYLVEEN